MSAPRGGDPEALGEILSKFLRDAKRRGGRTPANLEAAWREVAGETVVRNTRISSARHGVVTVEVFSAALKQELEVYRREELLAALRSRLPDMALDRLSFRLA
jgi:hypothetical protein